MRDGKIKRLTVTTPQGTAGELHKASRYAFNYTTTDDTREVSLIMPLRAESYADTALPTIFAMNKPEGYLADRLWERFGKEFDLDDMRLLAITGANQIGRLRYAEPGREQPLARPNVGLDTLLASGASEELFEYLVNAYLTSGISGFQPKVMIPDANAVLVTTPSATPEARSLIERSTAITPDLIVKSAGHDYPYLAQNEFLCMSAAKKAGLLVPDFWLSDDGSLFVMRRFDLRGPAQTQLGFEDMAVLLRKTALQKYQSSYEQVAQIIALMCLENAPDSLARYFDYLALSVMVRNGDAHLKNFGLLYDYPNGAAPALSPLYDVVTTSAYDIEDPQSGRKLTDRKLALKLNKVLTYPDRKALLQFARLHCGIGLHEAARSLDRIATAVEETLLAERHRVESQFMQRMQQEWQSGLFSLQ
jgi:serine/threonine-protein kinase HipA